MTDNDRISGGQGSVKPEETLTEIVRSVAVNRDEHDSAPLRAAANGAFIRWLKELESSDSEEDQRILQFALESHGFESVNEFVGAFFDAGEPVMAARKNLDDLDLEEPDLDDEDLGFALMESDEDGGDDGQ